MPDGAVSAVKLELLDGFRLEVDGRPVDVLASAQRLLAYLAFYEPVPRVVVAGTLWADVSDKRALARLRTTLWRCNRAVSGLVTAEGARLALASSVHVDVAELRQRTAGLLGGAAGSANGSVASLPSWSWPSLPSLQARELLPGWYDDWIVFERERLRLLRLNTIEAAAGRLLDAGRHAAALEFALEAVRSEPLRESAHRAVIAVHLAQNNVAEAVLAYRRFRQLLLDDVGIEPSEELTHVVFGGPRRRASG